VAFRLTLWYAGIFTVSLFVAFLLFYTLVLQSQGISREALAALREDFREYFGNALIIVILASTLIGWFMARRALSGVDKVTQTAIAISQGELDKRVPVTGQQDEIGRLAQAFNGMLNRIQTLIHQMEEVTDNIAHDLRSPIARIRGIAEGMLTSEPSPEERLPMLGTIIDESDCLLEMINTMLDISEAEAGLARLHPEKIDTAALVRDVCELFQPMAEEKGIKLTIQLTEGLYVSGDLRKLQRVLANLLDNALKYTPAGGDVRMSVAAEERQLAITIEDTGTGIPEEEVPHIFERFYRGEKSRSAQGNGLGLTLARAFITAHGGRIMVTSSPGKGSTFTVVLPRR
jgi:signal transduction histidine kinase